MYKSTVFLRVSNNYREKENLKDVISSDIKKTRNALSSIITITHTTSKFSGLKP